MTFERTSKALRFGFALLFIAGAVTIASAQGRGGGKPASAGPPAGNPGANRGLGTASGNSGGRSDVGLGKASSRSDGRSDVGLDRARNGGANRSIPSDNELNRYRGISRRLGVAPETLRLQYEAALASNPDLKFGQFVAANVIAANIGTRNSSVTASSILAGLQSGDSIGKTLQKLGVNPEEAKQIKKDAERQMKESRKN